MVENLFVKALALHQAGRFDEAKALYDQVLRAAPGHVDTLHMLGLIAFQSGQNEAAVELMSEAARCDPTVPSLHSNLGLALKAARKLEEAVESFRRALDLAPGMAEAHHNLGQALLEQGFVAAAAERFARAAGLKPSLAEAHAGLGDALWSLGKLEAAEESHLRAAALAPESVDALTTLAVLALARGDSIAALSRIRQALARDRTVKARRSFTDIVRAVQWSEDDPVARALMTRALVEDWARPAALAPAVAALVRLRLAAGGAVEDDELLRALLVATPIADPVLEAALTSARSRLLAAALAGSPINLDFVVALARQCWLNEYVFAEMAEENSLVWQLQNRIEAMASIPAPLLAVLACYRPLAGLARRVKTEGVAAALLAQQQDEPEEEKRLASALPKLTPITEAVSRAVRAQYEDNPYPRWTRLASSPPVKVPLRLYLASRFPFAGLLQSPEAPSVLIAGCGTGQEALEFVRNTITDGVLAMDLSRASLAHAARKAKEVGETGIRFGQGDILAAAMLGESFDVILAAGVLHHLADPFAGWRALLAQLKPGGLMGVAFYSAIARREITEARAWIARQGFTPTPGGIRACRVALKDRDGNETILGSADFYSLSGCRDLLFHVQESGLTLAQISGFLRENNLTLIGLETDEAVSAAYRARFPDDAAAVDLANWAAFEADHPQTFAAMYHFWVRKDVAP